jgi:flagellar basal-body rod protein FlgB
LSAAGQQNDLTLAALDEMDTPAWIESNRLTQGQDSPGPRLPAPQAELQQTGAGEDEREDTGQDAENQEGRLGRHSGRRHLSAGAAGLGLRASAFVRMQVFDCMKMNKSLTAGINLLFRFPGQNIAMDPTKIGLFDVAEKRLVWTAQRQSVLAANIANANTPSYQARDVASFASVLAGQGGVEPSRTQPGHMTGTVSSGLASLTKDPPKARGLDGNSVTLDQQLTKVADTETTQALVTTVWKKYMGMFSLALGRSS